MNQGGRLSNIIDMLSFVTEDEVSFRIDFAKGKYKMPKTLKDGIKLAKRIRKYGNNEDNVRGRVKRK
jgi:hypothetical protein